MRDIIDNWIFLSSKNDIDKKFIQPFWERLSMFLAINVGKCPNIIFTNDSNLWKNKYEGGKGRAFYNEDIATIIMWAPSYLPKRRIVKNNISKKLESFYNESNYKYIMPLNDIYHEMIHHIQFVLGDWLYDDLLEGSAEISTFLITGQNLVIENNINEYSQEQIALWYIGRKLLKLQPWEFYIFVRDCIVDSDFYKEYFSDDPKFVKILANEYGGSVEKLFNTMRIKMGKKKLYTAMLRDLKRIHNKLFYNW